MSRTAATATNETPSGAAHHLLAYLEEGRVCVYAPRRQSLWIIQQLPQAEELRIETQLRELHRTERRTAVVEVQLRRDEETLRPVEYYCKLPKDAQDGQVIVVDPALATGGSAAAAIDFIKQRGYTRIKLLSLIASPQGVKKVAEAHPDVKIYIAHYADAPLNEKGYIMTAFGDAGDRIFGTK